MAIHYTYKGKAVDMGAMLMMNEHAIAVGNANLNARGDRLGAGGTIIQTVEELATEYYQHASEHVVDTDEDVAVADDMFAVEQPVEDLMAISFDDLAPIEPVAPVAPKRRKAPASGE